MASVKSTSWVSRVKDIFAKTYVRKGLRIARVGFLTYGVYTSGYHMGMAKYAEDPQEMDRQLMMQIVRSSISTMGADSVGEDASAEDSKHNLILKKDTQEYKVVQRVSLRVLKAAKEFCNIQLQESKDTLLKISKEYQNTKESSNTESNEKSVHLLELVKQAAQTQNEMQYWSQVKQQLKGHWHCIVINSKDINAFVTNVCPRKIFVHKGLFQVHPTEDELAMVLSHELSHLMLKHNEKKTEVSATLAIMQLLLLTLIDPTGLGSFFIDLCVGNLADYLSASNSRTCEAEADELGLKILSLACYNIKKGTGIFEKFGLLENHAKTGWFSTHPSSDERLLALRELANSEELQKGKLTEGCKSLQRLFFRT